MGMHSLHRASTRATMLKAYLTRSKTFTRLHVVGMLLTSPETLKTQAKDSHSLEFNCRQAKAFECSWRLQWLPHRSYPSGRLWSGFTNEGYMNQEIWRGCESIFSGLDSAGGKTAPMTFYRATEECQQVWDPSSSDQLPMRLPKGSTLMRYWTLELGSLPGVHHNHLLNQLGR